MYIYIHGLLCNTSWSDASLSVVNQHENTHKHI